jgi:hypothetical protein
MGITTKAFVRLARLVPIIACLTICSFKAAIAQPGDLRSREQQLSALYAKLYESRYGDGEPDSADSYSEQFGKQFIAFIEHNPATLSHPFKVLSENNPIQIRTSGDGNFRMYTWDNVTGGTMRFFRTVYQWKCNGQTFIKALNTEEDDPGSFVSEIFTVHVGGSPHYLAVTNGIYSSKESSQSVSVFRIDSCKLNDSVRLFRTRTARLNSIDVYFDFFSVAARPERPLRLITYDEKRKVLLIPVADEKGKVSNGNLRYQLKGAWFTYTGIENGK